MIINLKKLKNFFEKTSDYKNARNISRLISVAQDDSQNTDEAPEKSPGPVTLPGDNYYTYKYIPPGSGISQMGGGNYFEVITDKEEDQYQRVGFLMGPDGTYDTDTGVKTSETLGWRRLMSGGMGQGMEEAKKNNPTPEGSILTQTPATSGGGPTQSDVTLYDQNYPDAIISGSVKVKDSVDLQNVTSGVRKFINSLGNKYIQLKNEGQDVDRPVITSGYRNHKAQTRIIIRNFEQNGGIKPDNTGIEKGRAYIQNLYGEKGLVYAEILVRHKRNKTDPFEELYEKVAGGKSGHTASPAVALDLRNTRGILQILNSIKDVNFKTLDETRTAGPHYHITVTE